MPRSRVTETVQRQSPRGPTNLRTSSTSSSDPPHLRLRSTERNPKQADGRSPRGNQSNPLNQKKLGTRIADLESQLGLAQEELKNLKDQLVSTETAKKAAHDQLDKKSEKQQEVPETFEIEENHSTQQESETDVFEVPIEKVTMEPQAEVESSGEENELKPKPPEPENPLFDELALKNDEIVMLKMNLDEKEKELEALRLENESLKSQLDEKSDNISSAESKVDELTLRLNEVGEDLKKSKSSEVEINEKLEAVEKEKEELEDEMKTLRVQTEQWRKAADAAASVLAGGVEVNGRRISGRCGSMDTLYGNAFDGGYTGYVGSPGVFDDSDEGEKRKGIRMFGDLWKKKGHK